ncbi:hypothetical protein DRJ25_01155 [Candidatus Woesearchaeota archaeon]|nr:MAG: hypothetical protein DRJ25_01155 [Candidatus Woesearchaeota archaeon]
MDKKRASNKYKNICATLKVFVKEVRFMSQNKKINLREELKKKVLEKYRQTPEYNILLKIIKQKKISTTEKLKKYVQKQIKEDQEWLETREKNNKDGTMNRWLVRRAKRLDLFKTLDKKILKLL